MTDYADLSLRLLASNRGVQDVNAVATAVEAQTYATLALKESVDTLVEHQRIANIIALGQYTTAPGDMPVFRTVIWEGDDLRPDIRKALGL